MAPSGARTPRLLGGKSGRTALAGQVKVADLIVRRRAIPHAALGIPEEFSHGEFRMRKRIFDHLSRFRVKAPNYVHIVGVVPKITVRIETQSVRTWIRAGQWKFLEGLRLGIEPQHLAAEKFAGIDHAV